VVLTGGVLVVATAAVTRYTGVPAVLAFLVAAVAVALLAAVVGRSAERLGARFGPGATGVLQSALGNLPELFIGFFALKAGLIAVVQAAIIGSIRSNSCWCWGWRSSSAGRAMASNGSTRKGPARGRSSSCSQPPRWCCRALRRTCTRRPSRTKARSR
jgi:hypothetical protein